MSDDLFQTHRATVYRRVLRRTGDPVEAEDLTQEVMLRAHTGIGKLKDPKAALAWLLRITDRVCIDRSRRKELPLLEKQATGALEPEDRTPTGLQMAQQNEMSACTRLYVDRLSPNYRRVLLLHDVEGRSAKEIAAALGISEGAAKIRLHRAREKLRELLNRACWFSRDERDVFVCEPKE